MRFWCVDGQAGGEGGVSRGRHAGTWRCGQPASALKAVAFLEQGARIPRAGARRGGSSEAGRVGGGRRVHSEGRADVKAAENPPKTQGQTDPQTLQAPEESIKCTGSASWG